MRFCKFISILTDGACKNYDELPVTSSHRIAVLTNYNEVIGMSKEWYQAQPRLYSMLNFKFDRASCRLRLHVYAVGLLWGVAEVLTNSSAHVQWTKIRLSGNILHDACSIKLTAFARGYFFGVFWLFLFVLRFSSLLPMVGSKKLSINVRLGVFDSRLNLLFNLAGSLSPNFIRGRFQGPKIRYFPNFREISTRNV
jgi:hypothetical protein